MRRELKKNWIWYVGLVFFFVAMAWGTWFLTNRINYKWYWGRLPQYFIFSGYVDRYATGPGEVEIEILDGGKARVFIEYEDNTSEEMNLPANTLEVEDGDFVNSGDKVGAYHVVEQGILLKGLITTLELSLYSSLLGLVIGLVAGLGRVSKNPMSHGIATVYVEMIRGTPLLVQIFIFYFFIGTVMDLGRFMAGVLALAIFAGAYIGEILRAGIQSINKGQMEAARSLGMNYFQAMIHVILPQAFKRTMPPLAGQFISLIKDSSLVSVIAITDLTKAGREVIASTFATFEIWFTIAGMYFFLTFTLSMLIRYIERRFSISD